MNDLLNRFSIHTAINFRSKLRSIFITLNKLSTSTKLGIIIITFFIFVAIFAPLISPYDPYQMGLAYLKPSWSHLLGTNDVGQDILSELIYGTRISLFIGILSSLVVTVVGTILGIASGYYGGLCDKIIMQFTSIAMTIPSLPILVILVAYLGPSIWNVIFAICFLSWTGTARIIRSKVLQLKEMPFIKIEQTLGASNIYIMKHILPNILDIVFIRAILRISGAMLTEAGLSFLGFGSIGQKSWGQIIRYAFARYGVINDYWWWYIPPIICISLCVLGFMLLGYSSGPSRKKQEKQMLSLKVKDYA
jgi:peptide/nickel transport system permease protein